jgi:hypothetical protein
MRFSSTPEKAGLGPRTSVIKQRAIKADRLKGQLFACKSLLLQNNLVASAENTIDTVTNQGEQ